MPFGAIERPSASLASASSGTTSAVARVLGAADAFDADLAAAWSWAMDRAREGFANGGAQPARGRLHAAAYLELALGEKRCRAGGDRLAGEIPLGPESARGLLDSIYRGGLDAELMESGLVR